MEVETTTQRVSEFTPGPFVIDELVMNIRTTVTSLKDLAEIIVRSGLDEQKGTMLTKEVR